MAETSGAIVLAGGESSRMGQDKALLPYKGTTLLEHILATLTGLVGDVVVVTDAPNRYTLSTGRLVTDIFPESGPVGGILTGLTTLGPGSHIVVACDMPNLNASVLQLLLKAVTLEWDAVVPEVEGQPEPLCAIYRHTAAPRLMSFLESGKRSAREALGALRVKRVGEGVLRRVDPTLACFTNINTPEDFEALLNPPPMYRRA